MWHTLQSGHHTVLWKGEVSLQDRDEPRQVVRTAIFCVGPLAASGVSVTLDGKCSSLGKWLFGQGNHQISLNYQK